MLRINLLATKSTRKHDSARQELTIIVAVVLVIVAGLAVLQWSLGADLDEMRARIRTVREEMKHLTHDVVRVEDYKKKGETLERKIKVITDLQQKRVGPAHLLDDLAVILTEQPKVWLTRVEDKGGSLVLEGGAMEHENISDFQLALERRSKRFRSPHLEYVKGAKSAEVAYFEWKIICQANYVGG